MCVIASERTPGETAYNTVQQRVQGQTLVRDDGSKLKAGMALVYFFALLSVAFLRNLLEMARR